jgi:hypothetical protein
VEISGKLAKWHPVTLTFAGPETSERAMPNPFTDYRLDVTLVARSGQHYVVPGFYAADGNAAITAAESGDKWRVHFSADEAGPWSYRVRFLHGTGVALADDPQGDSAGFMDDMEGTVEIGPADKPGNGFYGKGRLQYVGERYQRFAETGEYFLKVGADAPENLFAYEDFDATPNVGKRRKTWAPHLQDYHSEADDLLWGPNRDKGKALLGAVNYLSGKGMNAFSFLTFNVAGDDENVFMHLVKKDLADYEANHGKNTPDKAWTTSVERLRVDVSKTDQWDRVMRYADRKGMFLHFKTSEAENCKLMDGGELVRDAAERGPRAAYAWLLKEAAQGRLLYNDDTPMRILELTARLHRNEPVHEDDPQRRGVFTTTILSEADGRPTISLFFTGARHSGENLRALLAERLAGLPPPMQMCDALARNLPRDLETTVANCLSHGRRNFYELAETFPAEVQHVLACLKEVYRIDGQAKKQGLSPHARLRLHQEHSGPVMESLLQWLNAQIDERKVEPNSSLGQAIAYMLRHWEKLTLFLREPGAPLDNNVCEQALKMAIRHRKNSLFYKTQRGAEVGDLYMSLIHTCDHAQADPFDYLTELQRHHQRVIQSPGDWLPWNYRQQLARTPPPSPDA